MILSDNDKFEIFSRRDTDYIGQFYMGVTSTSIVCRPGCPARLPKRENCVFFDTLLPALQAGFRTCKRCRPEAVGEAQPRAVAQLLAALDTDPDHKWSEADIHILGIDPSTARRQFQAQFGMSFLAYARQKRLARAVESLDKGEPVIGAQLDAGYESASGFRAAFAKTFGQAPKHGTIPPLSIAWLPTPLGTMMAICDEQYLYLLEFTNRKNMARQFERLTKIQGRAVIPSRTSITDHIEAELQAYFSGNLRKFTTPLMTSGTDFQRDVWTALCEIPFGQTWTYSDLATHIGKDKAVRAVASSNANNGMALIIPCHRVIAKGGGLGGYAGGLAKKSWLIAHERRISEARA